MIVSEFNRLDGGRYFDVESQTSFEFDHVSQVYSGELFRAVSRTYADEYWDTESFRSPVLLLRLAEH